jgi:hypothetical protein
VTHHSFLHLKYSRQATRAGFVFFITTAEEFFNPSNHYEGFYRFQGGQVGLAPLLRTRLKRKSLRKDLAPRAGSTPLIRPLGAAKVPGVLSQEASGFSFWTTGCYGFVHFFILGESFSA